MTPCDTQVTADVAGVLVLTALALYTCDNPAPPGESQRSSRAPKVSSTLGPAGLAGRF